MPPDILPKVNPLFLLINSVFARLKKKERNIYILISQNPTTTLLPETQETQNTELTKIMMNQENKKSEMIPGNHNKNFNIVSPNATKQQIKNGTK